MMNKEEKINYSNEEQEEEITYISPPTEQLRPTVEKDITEPIAAPKGTGFNKKIFTLIGIIILAGFFLGIIISGYSTKKGEKPPETSDVNISQKAVQNMPDNIKNMPKDYSEKQDYDKKILQSTQDRSQKQPTQPKQPTFNFQDTTPPVSTYGNAGRYNPSSPQYGNYGSGSMQLQPQYAEQEKEETLALKSPIGFFRGNESNTKGTTGQPDYAQSALGGLNSNGTTNNQQNGTNSEYNAQNAQSEKRLFTKNAEASFGYLNGQLERPISRFEIKSGTIIPGLLLTAINSDLPGMITGTVSENVYDSATGNYLLIPQGTKIVGTYDSQISFNQERVLIVWSKLIYPNSTTLYLEAMPGTDAIGQAGVTGDVDNHGYKLAGAALTTALLAAGAQMAAGGNGTNVTNGQLAVSGAAQAISDVGQQIVSRDLNIQPTIKIASGTRFNVFVNKDMVLSPYRG